MAAITKCGICWKEESPTNLFVYVQGPAHLEPHLFHTNCINTVINHQMNLQQPPTCPCLSRITHVNGKLIQPLQLEEVD